jgi:hypothetical protein
VKPRIPVFDTVGHGFYFGLTRYFSILKITWLPALIAGSIVAFEVSTQLLAARGGLKHTGHLSDYVGMLGWIPVYALLSIPAVAAYRMAVFGQQAPKGLAYFKFGGTELQFMAAQLVTTVYMMVYIVIVLAIVVPLALVAYYFFVPSDSALLADIAHVTSALAPADPITWRLRIGSGAIVFFLGLSAFGAILFSLVQPIVVIEHRIGVWKSLRLLWLGNAVRLAIAWAIVGITFVFFTTVVIAALNAFGPRILMTAMPDFDQKNLGHLMLAWIVLILAPFLLLGVLALGVTAGVNGFAYRKLALQIKKEPSQLKKEPTA